MMTGLLVIALSILSVGVYALFYGTVAFLAVKVYKWLSSKTEAK